MPRIFVCFAVANAMLFSATGVFGLMAVRVGVDRHALIAVLSLLMSCALQVVAFTYLTVTGKMIAQAVYLADLDLSMLAEVKTLKRSVTFWLPLVVASLALVTATGAWLWRGGEDPSVHYLSAAAVIVVHAWVWWREYSVIVKNSVLLSKALNAYASRPRANGAIPPAT